MIKELEKQKLKKILGNKYSPLVLKYLSDKGITSKNGKPFTTSMIRLVLNGVTHHLEIEKAIIAVATQVQKENEALDLQKSKLIS